MVERSSRAGKKLLVISAISISLAAGLIVDSLCCTQPAEAAMMGGHHSKSSKSSHSSGNRGLRTQGSTFKARAGKKQNARTQVSQKRSSRAARLTARGRGKDRQARLARGGRRGRAQRHARMVAKVHHARKAIPPQLYLEKLNQLTLKPGIVYKFCHGSLNVNVADVDMKHADVKVRPYLASQTFDSLKSVERHAKESGALVAVNANYFKKDGTPLGTIKVDGEWVSGSLFNRVAMGISDDGDLKFARVNLHGILETSNSNVPSLWVNNMNQPRRHGARLIVYTRRWGSYVTLPYEGVLVSVGNRGEVLDVSNRSMTIPYGGYVLTDLKDSALANLSRGDFVDLNWFTDPENWDQVESAVSGGPTLIKDGKLFVGLQGEHFKAGWTSAKITRRTACGVTADNHLILATVEGPHNMWDLAKFMQQLGCVEAMNLDGGGSTTMVVNGKTVTRNVTGSQRKVAASIIVLEPDAARRLVHNPDNYYHPISNLTEFYQGPDVLFHMPMMSGLLQARAQQQELDALTLLKRKPRGWLGMDGPLLPPDTISEKPVANAPVVTIDNDAVKSGASSSQNDAAKPKDNDAIKTQVDDAMKRQTGDGIKMNVSDSTKSKLLPPAQIKAKDESSQPFKTPKEVSKTDATGNWTTKIFKPFRFSLGKHRS